MTTPDYARVKQLFNDVCDLPSRNQQRERLQILGASPAEITRVLTLLDEDARTDHSISLTQGVVAAVMGISQELHPGERLGAFTLVKELGHGGMGQVFLAERSDGHYQQRVAIKMLLGPPGRDALALLARERQILARLNHANIARLLDGGTTPQGRPYLVMEYVDGVRIDEHCKQRGLDLAQRLALFAQVCEAVAEAHRQLIVHADLKPGNVLVDAQGGAKLLDFGVARLPGQEGTTLFGSSAGHTPRYASPEQLQGKSPSVSSDIFSLGRILEELIQAAPEHRRRRELDAIVAKATAPAADARYPSVGALLSDLGRFEQHQPLRALEGHRRYVAAKWLRRRWPWAAAGLAAVVASSVFTVSLVRQRDRAERESQMAQQVSRLMVSLFEGADPAQSGRPELSARELIDRGRERVRADLRDQPAVQGRMLAVLAKVYSHLGRAQDALPLVEQALGEAAADVSPAEHADWLALKAQVLLEQWRDADAAQAAREALAAYAALRTPPEVLAVADAHGTLGTALSHTGDFEQARRELLLALELRRTRVGDAHLQTARSLHELAQLARAEGKFEDGVATASEAVELKKRLLPPDDPRVLQSQQLLASLLGDLHRYGEATALQRTVLDARRKQLGDDSGLVALSWSEVGSTLQDGGQTTEAIQAYREAVRIETKLSGRAGTGLAVRLNNLATALEELGDPEAEARYRESLALRESQLPAGDIHIARARANLGRYLMRQGRLDEAHALLERSLQERLAKLKPEHYEVTDTRLSLAEVALRQRRRADAEAQLALLKPMLAQLRPVKQAQLGRLQALMARQDGQPEQALQAQQSALDKLVGLYPDAHPSLLRPQLETVELELAAGQAAAAKERLASLQARLDAQHAQSPLRAWAAQLRGQLKG